jgi:hypothetical protein
MPIPIKDLGECRTGYIDDTFAHSLEWSTENIDPLIVETIEASRIVTNEDTDTGTTLSYNGNFTYRYTGNFTIESFPNVTMEFRDFETESDTVTITGWPPSDERAKDMFNFSLDPRDARTYKITIEWKISATEEVVLVPPSSTIEPIIGNHSTGNYVYDSDLDKYVRTDTFTWMIDAVNRTGEQFGVTLAEYMNSNFSYESTAVKKEVDGIKSAFPISTVEGTYASTETTISRSYSPSNSEWSTNYSEELVMDTLITSDSSSDWALRVGKGGQIYSLKTPALGETVPPQYRSGGGQWAPWVDEVWQTVSVYDKDGAKFNHSSGVYLKDPILTEPFYTPRLATEIDEPNKSFYSMNWMQPSAKPLYNEDNPSHIINLTKYKDLGDGVIEMTLGMYNFSNTDVYHYHNMPWGGVRRTALEYNYTADTNQTTYTQMTGRFADAGPGRTMFNTDRTGGWTTFCSENSGDYGQSMGIVFGKDRQLANTYLKNRIRQGYTQLTPKSSETDWRNYIVFTLNVRHNINQGEGIWTRQYIVFGETRADVENKIKSRNLVDNTIFEDMNISEDSVDVIGYQIINDNGNFVIDKSSTPDFYLYSAPVSGTVPVFEIINRDNSRFVSWNPYKVGTHKMYDDLVKVVNLLGFTSPTAVYADSLDSVFDGPFEHSYKADGKLLSGVIS